MEPRAIQPGWLFWNLTFDCPDANNLGNFTECLKISALLF